MKKNHISKETIIAEIVDKYPYLAMYIMDYGVHCINCGIASYETLEQGFMAHGMSESEVDDVIVELNKVIDENDKK